MDGAQESEVLSTWLPPVVALIQKPENQKETQVRLLNQIKIAQYTFIKDRIAELLKHGYTRV